MNAILSLGMGYFIGCISPSSWLSKKKHVDLTQEGTKNLGATNTALVLGKAAGIFVLIFDIFKSFLSFKLAKLLFPSLRIAGILASIGAILGHCFPVFMRFQGGKGLAAFGGLILAYKPWMFFVIIALGIAGMFITNTGVIAPMVGCFLFPVLVWFQSGDWMDLLAVLSACALVFAMHWSNLKRTLSKNDLVHTNEFMSKVFGDKS